jgi:phosphoglycerate dehydrogenase-like enzyme
MDAQRRKAWEPLLGARAPRDLKGQTAVVIGLGPVGQEIARLLKAIEMRVIGITKDLMPCESVDEMLTFDNVHEALRRAEWLLLACPLTDITRGLINAKTIEILPPEACVINVSRGEVIVEADLIDALQTGRLAGAYLDVLTKEPLSPDSPLWSLPNVIITPHTAGHTTGHYAAVGEIFLDNLARWRDGQPLRNAIP